MLNHAEKWVLAGVRINLARKWKRASLRLTTDKNFTKRNLHVYPCANYVQSFPKADTRSWNSSHSVTTEPKGHQFYNTVTLKKIAYFMNLNSLNIKQTYSRNTTKNPPNMFLLDVRKNMPCTISRRPRAVFLTPKILHPWSTGKVDVCVILYISVGSYSFNNFNWNSSTFQHFDTSIKSIETLKIFRQLGLQG